MIRCIKDNAPKAMSDFMAAKSYEELFNVVMDQVERVWRVLCECRGVVDAIIGCVTNYDGLAFILSGTDRTTFDAVVNRMDWEAMSGVLHGYLNAICGEENGEDCLSVFHEWQMNGAKFWDNTYNGVDSCTSLVKAEEATGEY